MTIVWDRVWNLVVWVLQVALSGLFLVFGATKFAPGVAYWRELFGRIGLGPWLQYVTGGLEVICAILLLVPRASAIAAAVLIGTMVGAVLTHLLILGDGSAWFFPALPLVLLIPVVWKRHRFW